MNLDSKETVNLLLLGTVCSADYLEVLLGFKLIIIKATCISDHSKTLIDHIYTNTPQKLLKYGILFTCTCTIAGISDHLPVLCIMVYKFPETNGTFLFRDSSDFNKDFYLKRFQKPILLVLYSRRGRQ